MQPAMGRTSTGTLTVVLTLLFWTSIPLFLRYFSEQIDAWTSNGWRYGFSALLWAPLVVFRQMRGSLPRGIWRASLVPSVVNAMGQVTFCYAHYKIDPALLTFGLRSQIIFAAIGAYIMFAAERPIIRSPVYLAGLVVLVAGTAGAVLLGDGPALAIAADRAAYIQGVGLSLLSGALFAGYALTVRRYMSGYGSVVSFAVISQYTAAAMVALMLVLGRRGGLEALDMSGGDFMLLLLSAVIGIALGHVLYYMSIARLGVAVSSGILQLHPFTVGVASYLIFTEVLTTAQWVSGSLAVVGAILMLTVRRRVPRRTATAAAAAAPATPAAQLRR